MKRTVFASFAALAVAVACAPDLDFDKYQDIKYTGNWGVPLAVASFSLEDLLVDDSTFTVDPDGGLRFIYEDDSLAEFSIADFANVPEQDPVETTISMGTPFFSLSSGLGTVAGAKFKSIALQNGSLRVVTINNLLDTVDVRITIENATLAGQPFVFDIIALVGTVTTTLDISDLEIDLTNGNTTVNYLSFEIEILNDRGAQATDEIDMSLQYESIEFKEAIGYFGQRIVSIPNGSFQLGAGALSDFMSGLYLANPQAELSVITNIGLPLELSVNMNGISAENNVENLGLDPIRVEGPSTVGNIDTTRVIVDRNTSNIVEFIANVPQNILYDGSGTMNPDGETGTDNFITSEGLLRLGLKLDLPFELRTKNLVFQQTINDKLFDGITEEEANYIEELTLRLRVRNEFPLEADIKLRFYDELTGLPTDSVMLHLMDAADVDSQGRSTGYVTSVEEEVITGEKAARIIKSGKVDIIVILNTTDNGNTTVKIYNDYDIEVSVGAKVKLDYKL